MSLVRGTQRGVWHPEGAGAPRTRPHGARGLLSPPLLRGSRCFCLGSGRISVFFPRREFAFEACLWGPAVPAARWERIRGDSRWRRHCHMVQVSASPSWGQLGFAADCSCQVQCPRRAFDVARCVCAAAPGEGLSPAAGRGGFWEHCLDEAQQRKPQGGQLWPRTLDVFYELEIQSSLTPLNSALY